MLSQFKTVLIGTTGLVLLGTAALAQDFDIPRGDLKAALDAYMKQSGVALMYPPTSVRGVHSDGVRGDLPPEAALVQILSGTGFSTQRSVGGAIGIVPEARGEAAIAPLQLAQATPSRTSVETVTVTSSKLGGADVQTVPISITALSQEQLNAQKIEGGPDLLKSVPNMSFTKTNFSGYNIQIRGIGTQAVSVTTDPAVAVAFNDTPFIRNHFFEQEFFDVAQVEVLRGPQGTLYGRNATGGVVNITSARATDKFEGQIKGEVGNYETKRLSGFINIPLIGDKLDMRLAGALTDREGYDYNETTKKHVNGRKLWSTRATLSANPTPQLHADLIWEHFDENDDRSRTGKQFCHHDSGPTTLGDIDTLIRSPAPPSARVANPDLCTMTGPMARPTASAFLSCSWQRPPVLPDGSIDPNAKSVSALNPVDPYGGLMQSKNLRTIASVYDPKYRAQSDTIELNAGYDITPQLTLYSQTGYNHDHLYSTQDYNRFNTQPIFNDSTGWYYTLLEGGVFVNGPSPYHDLTPGGIFCDPQFGCTNKIAGIDISQEHATQFSQEVRLSSNLEGPFNFNFGANYMHYHTVEDYYVLHNLFTLFAESTYNHSTNPALCNFSGDLSVPLCHLARQAPKAAPISTPTLSTKSMGRGTTITAAKTPIA